MKPGSRVEDIIIHFTAGFSIHCLCHCHTIQDELDFNVNIYKVTIMEWTCII